MTCTSSMQPRNQGSTCPTSGVAKARYTRGSIDDGPGVSISRFGGLSSPMCGLLLMFSASKKRGHRFSRTETAPRNGQFGAYSRNHEEGVPPRPIFLKDLILRDLRHNRAQTFDSKPLRGSNAGGLGGRELASTEPGAPWS